MTLRNEKTYVEDYDYEDNISDEVVWNRIYNEIDYCYNDELLNLNVDTEGEIIAIASMDLWNGRFRI